MVEVTAYSAVKPPTEILSAPKACIDAANAPPAELTRYAKETGGEATDFANAAQAPSAPSADSCTVLFRAVAAGSMQTVTGYKITVDGVSKTAELRKMACFALTTRPNNSSWILLMPTAGARPPSTANARFRKLYC
jgi:hypothetical protein